MNLKRERGEYFNFHRKKPKKPSRGEEWKSGAGKNPRNTEGPLNQCDVDEGRSMVAQPFAF